MKESSANKQPSDETLARLLKLAGPRPEPAAELRRDVYEQVQAVWRDRTRRGAAFRRFVPAAIAATLIGAVTVLLWSQVQQAPVFAGPVGQLDRGGLEIETDGAWRGLQSGELLAGDAQVRTGAQGRAGVILANGISLRLDHDTQLRLQTPGRIALHQGRLYIDTAGQRIHTGIEIVTAGGVVRDIGTQFEVTVDAARTRVRVRDGEVVLNTAIEEIQAGRGESLATMADGRVVRMPIASHDVSWDWAYDVAPLFDTDGRLVAELIDWVARETGRETNYADAVTRNAAASTRIRGSVSGRTPEETLDLALATTRFRYHIDDIVVAIEKHD